MSDKIYVKNSAFKKRGKIFLPPYFVDIDNYSNFLSACLLLYGAFLSWFLGSKITLSFCLRGVFKATPSFFSIAAFLAALSRAVS
jgi:hypothetical protein